MSISGQFFAVLYGELSYLATLVLHIIVIILLYLLHIHQHRLSQVIVLPLLQYITMYLKHSETLPCLTTLQNASSLCVAEHYTDRFFHNIHCHLWFLVLSTLYPSLNEICLVKGYAKYMKWHKTCD